MKSTVAKSRSKVLFKVAKVQGWGQMTVGIVAPFFKDSEVEESRSSVCAFWASGWMNIQVCLGACESVSTEREVLSVIVIVWVFESIKGGKKRVFKLIWDI